MIKDWPACANIVNQSIRGRLGIIGILRRYLQIRNRATLGSEDPRIPDQQVCPFRPVGSARAPCTLKYNLWTEIQRGLARQKTPTEFNWYSNIELILNCRCMSRILSTDVHSLPFIYTLNFIKINVQIWGTLNNGWYNSRASNGNIRSETCFLNVQTFASRRAFHKSFFHWRLKCF